MKSYVSVVLNATSNSFSTTIVIYLKATDPKNSGSYMIAVETRVHYMPAIWLCLPPTTSLCRALSRSPGFRNPQP